MTNRKNTNSENVKVFLSFSKSSSVNFKKALRLAKQLDSYSDNGNDAKPKLHKIKQEVPIDDDKSWGIILKLLELAGGWKSSTFQINDYNVPPKKFSDIFKSVQRCYLRKRSMGYDDKYCLSGDGKSYKNEPGKKFGCAFERGVVREKSSYSRLPEKEEDFFPESSSYSEYMHPLWIIFGKHNPKQNTFDFDKIAMKRRLLEYTTREACVACPAFSIERFDASLNELPDSISIDDQKYKVIYSAYKEEMIVGIINKADISNRSTGLTYGTYEDENIEEEDSEKHTASSSNNSERGKKDGTIRIIPEVKFSDIGGLSATLDEIKKVIVLPLTHPEYFKKLGIKGHKGILFYGPPGNGKTLIAKAIAGETKSHFELISGPEVKSKWYGQAEENLRKIFNRAQIHSPAIIFIDEIDSIAGERSGDNRNLDDSVVAQLLVLLDGMIDTSGVTVIAATNRIDKVDGAVIRPGRFDYHLQIPNPGEAERAEIWQKCLQKMNISEQIDFRLLSRKSNGFSGAAIAAACREAGLIVIQNAINSGIAPENISISEIALLDAIEKITKKRS